MIFGKSGESPKKVLSVVEKVVVKKGLKKYDAFYIIVPENLYL